MAYTKPGNPNQVLYRRSLGTQEPPYWLDAVTVEPGTPLPNQVHADSPALVKLGSTLGLFYRKATGGVKQGFLRTSTDYGKTWSSATQVITNSTVGQAIGPLQSSAYPNFDIKKLASGDWLLAWLNVSQRTGHSYCNNYSYPVLWTATSSTLGSASWSNKQEVTLAYDQGFFNVRYGANHPAIAQTGSGTVYLGYTFFWMYWDRYGYYRTSTDSGATWSSETVYAYEPTRGTQGSQGVTVQNVYLAIDNNGSIRSFWDQSTADGWSSNPDNYPTQLFRRDLPSGAIIPVSAVKEALSQCSVCVPWAAFGADRGSAWSQRSTTTEYTFNGQQDDPTLGLYYLRARYYDPYTGRFLSKDPSLGTCARTTVAAPLSYEITFNQSLFFRWYLGDG